LGGVVISGGEPTLYPALADLIARIRELGLKVKLDTNGLRPGVLEGLFAAPQTSPDYIALDLKTAPERYVELLPPEPAASPVPGGENRGRFAGGTPGAALRRSAALIRASGGAHEFRSLELPGGYFTAGDRAALAELAGDSPWKIRPFIPGGCLDPAWDRIA
jgi:pyruvate formate lyase activating enzyme